MGKNTGESDENGLGQMVVETVEIAEGPMLLVGALLEESVGPHDGVRVGELLGEQLGPTLGPLVGSVGALLGESVGAEGPILDGVAVGAAEEVYVGLYMMAVLDGNAVGSKYVTDLN